MEAELEPMGEQRFRRAGVHSHADLRHERRCVEGELAVARWCARAVKPRLRPRRRMPLGPTTTRSPRAQ